MSATPSLRSTKRERARSALVAAALELFARDGFEQTTVDDVAAAAEVSRRTFFRYFERKEDVVLAWLDEVGDVLVRAVAERPLDEPPIASLRSGALAVVDAYRERAPVVLAAVDLVERTPAIRAREREQHGRWEDELATELEGRLGSGRASRRRARLLAALAVAALTASVVSWRAERGRPDLADLVDEAFGAMGPA